MTYSEPEAYFPDRKTKKKKKKEAYSKPRRIQNTAIFRTLSYSKSEAYSEAWHTSMTKH